MIRIWKNLLEIQILVYLSLGNDQSIDKSYYLICQIATFNTYLNFQLRITFLTLKKKVDLSSFIKVLILLRAELTCSIQ